MRFGINEADAQTTGQYAWSKVTPMDSAEKASSSGLRRHYSARVEEDCS